MVARSPRSDKENNALKVVGRRGRCKYCATNAVVKDGRRGFIQMMRCKECGHKFRDNGRPPRMRHGYDLIAAAVESYFEGLSLNKTALILRKTYSVGVDPSTIWDWLMKYVPIVRTWTGELRPNLCGVVHADETVIPSSGRKAWFWDAIDEDSRFIVGTHLSDTRTTEETIRFMRDIAKWGVRPEFLVTDGMQAYGDAFNKVFYRKTGPRVRHIRSPGIRGRPDNNLIERFHGTLKDRTRPMRGFKADYSAKNLLDGFVVHHNFIREHRSLKMTPAEAVGISLPFDDGWGNLIQWATYWEAIQHLAQSTLSVAHARSGCNIWNLHQNDSGKTGRTT